MNHPSRFSNDNSITFPVINENFQFLLLVTKTPNIDIKTTEKCLLFTSFMTSVQCVWDTQSRTQSLTQGAYDLNGYYFTNGKLRHKVIRWLVQSHILNLRHRLTQILWYSEHRLNHRTHISSQIVFNPHCSHVQKPVFSKLK